MHNSICRKPNCTKYCRRKMYFHFIYSLNNDKNPVIIFLDWDFQIRLQITEYLYWDQLSEMKLNSQNMVFSILTIGIHDFRIMNDERWFDKSSFRRSLDECWNTKIIIILLSWFNMCQHPLKFQWIPAVSLVLTKVIIFEWIWKIPLYICRGSHKWVCISQRYGLLQLILQVKVEGGRGSDRQRI